MGAMGAVVLFHRALTDFPQAPGEVGLDHRDHRDHHLVQSMEEQGSTGPWGSVIKSSLPLTHLFTGEGKASVPSNSDKQPMASTLRDRAEVRRAVKVKGTRKDVSGTGGCSGMAKEDPGPVMASPPILQPPPLRAS